MTSFSNWALETDRQTLRTEASVTMLVVRRNPWLFSINQIHLCFYPLYSSRYFQLYKHGVYQNRKCSSKHLDHGVLVVGYGTYQNQEYWLMKNRYPYLWFSILDHYNPGSQLFLNISIYISTYLHSQRSQENCNYVDIWGGGKVTIYFF